jgi:hypothetical protein
VSTTVERGTHYYSGSGGKPLMRETIANAVDRARQLGVRKLLVFTSDGEGPIMASDLTKDEEMKIVAVTFPAGRVFRDPQGNIVKLGLSDPGRKKELEGRGIAVVQGTMPLQEIMTPGSRDTRLEAIVRTLGLMSAGLPLCVEAVLMATDAGVVSAGEEIIASSADTAIVATGALSHWLFHPEEGLDIREIICKPRSRLRVHELSGGGNIKGESE